MPSGNLETALHLWKEKLTELEKELAITDSASKKFELKNQIKECEETIKTIQAKVESLSSSTPNVMSTIQSSSNQRKIERLQRDLTLAQNQSNELTKLINVIVDESNENRGDFVRQNNLNKRKRRYEEERNQYDQEVERLQAEIDKLTYG